jgi:hypothetical protein
MDNLRPFAARHLRVCQIRQMTAGQQQGQAGFHQYLFTAAVVQLRVRQDSVKEEARPRRVGKVMKPLPPSQFDPVE